MTDYFEKAVAFVIMHEGGYVNNPADPGGETKYGISKRAYPMLHIKDLTLEDAKLIYKTDYWEKAGCAMLEWPMCLVALDTAVQHGVGRAKEFQAKSLNWTDMIFARLAFYNMLKKPMFLPGWVNRLIDLYKAAKGI